MTLVVFLTRFALWSAFAVLVFIIATYLVLVGVAVVDHLTQRPR